MIYKCFASNFKLIIINQQCIEVVGFVHVHFDQSSWELQFQVEVSNKNINIHQRFQYEAPYPHPKLNYKNLKLPSLYAGVQTLVQVTLFLFSTFFCKV